MVKLSLKLTDSKIQQTPPVYEIERLSKTYARNNLVALTDVNLRFSNVSSSPSSVLRAGKIDLVEDHGGAVATNDRKRDAGRSPSLGTTSGHRDDVPAGYASSWKTTIENIVLPIEIREGRTAAKAAYTRAKELLELVGLKDFANVYRVKLSGGMAQRASICRMLVADPAMLLLDEPFSALDELTRESLPERAQRYVWAMSQLFW